MSLTICTSIKTLENKKKNESRYREHTSKDTMRKKGRDKIVARKKGTLHSWLEVTCQIHIKKDINTNP